MPWPNFSFGFCGLFCNKDKIRAEQEQLDRENRKTHGHREILDDLERSTDDAEAKRSGVSIPLLD